MRKPITGKPRGPQRIGDILPEIMARRGFARIQSGEQFESAWNEAAGPLAAKYSRVGQVRRGALEVTVANSAMIQEFTFQKTNLLTKLNRLLPNQGIRDIRFRLGAVE